jgi:dihydroxyacid dehydratase/phosphogluconate dehydratase
MGTAVTMAIMAEALGLMLPGGAVIQSGDPAQAVLAEEAGRRIVSLVRSGSRPSSLLTPSGFERAMTVLAAVGGSTNAIIHLCAVAGRRGLSLPLSQFAAIAARTPVIADIAPTGTGLMPDLAAAGGVPAVLDVLFSGAAPVWPLRSPADPLTEAPAFTVVRGNIAPNGGVIKTAAASRSLLRHTGPAVVFHSYDEMRRRVDDPDLDVTADSVLVLAGCGPVGSFMPEWGNIPIPRRLLREGITDMVRITDGRMSGTGYGTVILHVAPESSRSTPTRAPCRRTSLTRSSRRGTRCCPRSPTGAAGRSCTAHTCSRRPTAATTTSCASRRRSSSASWNPSSGALSGD